MRENVVENEFVKAVRLAGGAAYKLTSQTANGLPDRLVLFFPGKTVFVELKAPGKMLRPLQRKRRQQLMKLGFPVLCIDRLSQIKPSIQAILSWTPGTPFPDGIGAEIPDLKVSQLPDEHCDQDDYTDTLEPEDPSKVAGFFMPCRGEMKDDEVMDYGKEEKSRYGKDHGGRGDQCHPEDPQGSGIGDNPCRHDR